MPKIALSYRREDSKAATHMLFSRLQAEFGRDAVFLDVDSIEPGVDFRKHIADALMHCDLVLAMIGSRWRGSVNGAQRIDDKADWVRIEVETAMAHGVAIIPVLIDETTMPAPAELPESIREIAYLNAVRLDTGADFTQHSDRIVKIIDTRFPLWRPDGRHVPDSPARLEARAAKSAWARRRPLLAGMATAIAVACFAAGLFLHRQDTPGPGGLPAAPETIAADAHDAGWEAGQGDAANQAQDYDTAFQWYRRAADKGSTHAKAQLGVHYARGLGVDEDDRKALQWTREAANEGDVKGMRDLGDLYFFGTGVPRDNTQSTAWYRKAADLGDVNSEYEMGMAYMDGFGVPKDDVLALQWFTKAAGHGQFAAMEQLGEFYDDGSGGLAKDPKLARLWMTNAARGGDSSAKSWLVDNPG